jgi:hypothetical protein
MKKLISLMAGLILGLVSAQSFPCESLLANYPVPQTSLTSIDQTITSLMTVDGQQGQSVMRQVIDYANKRLYQESDTMGMISIMRYNQGKASMGIKMGDEIMNVPIPEENAQGFESLFDQTGVQGVLSDYTLLSCDGQQSYAGLLSGEQVTISTEAAALGTMTSKVIFDANGKVLGSLTSVGGMGQILTIFEEMTLDAANYPIHLKMSSYTYKEDDTASLLSTTITDTTAYNQPVDETLFAE